MATMKLQNYIKERNLSLDQTAKDLGITKAWLYELVSERMEPGRKLAFEIMKWSDGMVKMKDLWKD